MMAAVRGKDTGPEMVIRRYLHQKGFRFRLHVKDLPGRPDLVFPKHKVVLFVHGCFWHRHPDCRYSTTPEKNADFWKNKFETNIARDRVNVEKLRGAGWRVIIVWACSVRTLNQISKLEVLVDLIRYSDREVSEWA
jgi:DNA mismatch endonuclease (patch repair protein)